MEDTDLLVRPAMPSSKSPEPSLRSSTQRKTPEKIKLEAGQRKRVDQLFSKLAADASKPGAWKPYRKG